MASVRFASAARAGYGRSRAQGIRRIQRVAGRVGADLAARRLAAERDAGDSMVCSMGINIARGVNVMREIVAAQLLRPRGVASQADVPDV